VCVCVSVCVCMCVSDPAGHLHQAEHREVVVCTKKKKERKVMSGDVYKNLSRATRERGGENWGVGGS
jgi:hypothetical protein